jgi:hypothetical protein
MRRTDLEDAIGVGLAVFGGALLLGAVFGQTKKERPPARTVEPTDEQILGLARSQLEQAARLLGVRAPRVELQREGNASSDGRIIRVNAAFLRGLLASFCDARLCQIAIVLGIMAHELGHHILRHAEQLDRRAQAAHIRELEADGVAGRVLALAGVPPDDFERVLAHLGRFHSDTHPHGSLRVEQLRAEYQRARLA